jgi:signal transduction histidine kinase/ActR/RegA family two-component response regulator
MRNVDLSHADAVDLPLSSGRADGNEPAHFVQFYDDDTFLVDSVSRFVATGLSAGDAGVVIATHERLEALAGRFAAFGLDVRGLQEQGHYVPLDAAETLSRFMVGGCPDAARFEDVVGSVIARAAEGHSRVRAFGEMVALLYADGRADAAIELERLWNDLGKKIDFSLCCAYPMHLFGKEGHEQPFAGVCTAHTHVVPSEGYAALETHDERLRTIAELQRKASALEAETAVRKRTEEDLKGKLELLAAVDRRKDEFLAMLGHELRNPLSAVRNALVTARLDESRRARALEIAVRQADQLARLVDDLLDVARITQGRIALRARRIRFDGAVERALETTRQMVEERGHRLTLSLAEGDPEVQGDATRLEQIIVNLITNAAKYTEPGGRIDVTSERDAGRIVLRVRDDGIGIASETLPFVFDLFAQAERALDRADGGLGIGLTVARRLAELHGGHLEARSDGPGKGAEFALSLPVLPPRSRSVATSPAKEPVPRVGGVAVLLVEDNRDAAESTTMLLEVLGHAVAVAHDGPAALSSATCSPPDVMLVDLGLPGMDGYEVARRIRRQPSLRRTVLVALTGYGRAEDRQRSAAAGFDHHLVKPIDVEALETILAGVRKPSPTAGSSSDGAVPARR